MAITRNSKQLHEISVSFLVEIDPDYDPKARAIELYDTLMTQELVEGMIIGRIEPVDFEKAVTKYDPRIWGTHDQCSSSCDVNTGCECHGGYEE
jgi:hypothetical protein